VGLGVWANEGSFGCEAFARALGQPNVPEYVSAIFSLFSVLEQQKFYCKSVSQSFFLQ
jgi:hypothetical protein